MDMTEKKVKATTIVFKPSDDGKSIILEEKRHPGFVYQYVAVPKFKEGGKVEIAFEVRMSGRLWPIYAVGMIVYYGLRALPTLMKMAVCKIFGHSPVEETVTVEDEDGRIIWVCRRIVCKRCYEEISHEEIKFTSKTISQSAD